MALHNKKKSECRMAFHTVLHAVLCEVLSSIGPNTTKLMFFISASLKASSTCCLSW